MRDDVRQIISDSLLMMEVIIKSKDIPEAKSFATAARASLCELADELANLPPEDEPIEGGEFSRKI